MSNTISKPKSPFIRKQTPIIPEQYANTSSYAQVSTKVVQQLFKPSTSVDRMIAVMSNRGVVSYYLLKLMHLSNSKTKNESAKNRPIFVSIPLDPNKYVSSANKVVYNNSATQMARVLFNPSSPYNSAIVTGGIGVQAIPKYSSNKEQPELQWDNEKHNTHVKVLAVQLAELESKNLTDDDKLKGYTQAWANYQAAEDKLIAKGILAKNMILVVDNEGLVPIISVNQNMSSSNKFLDSKTLFNNPNSEATYCPLVNKIDSIVALTDTVSDPNSDWVYGITSITSGDNPLQATSKEAYAYDFLNQKTEVPLRVVIQDSIGNRNRGDGNTRSERFEEFSDKNTHMQIFNGELSLGFTKDGGLTSIFSIGGDNLTYKAYEFAKARQGVQDTVNVNLDSDVEVDFTDLVDISNITIDMDLSTESEELVTTNTTESSGAMSEDDSF